MPWDALKGCYVNLTVAATADGGGDTVVQHGLCPFASIPDMMDLVPRRHVRCLIPLVETRSPWEGCSVIQELAVSDTGVTRQGRERRRGERGWVLLSL